VHFDVGNVRHWPKMSRRELIALLPDGKTLHVPSDGKPLPGFEQALASYQARKKSGNVAIASLGKSTSSSRSGGLLAAFFGGGGADDEEDSSTVDVASGGDDEGAAAPAAQPKAVKADAKAMAKAADNKIRIIPPELANPVEIPAVQQETIVAALPARDVPLPLAAPRPQVDVGAVDQTSMGLYSTEQPAAEPPAEPEIALNIPVPTPRPSSGPPPELQADADRAVILAAATSDTASDMDLPLPVARPGEPAADDEIAPLIAAASDEDPDQGEDAYTVASVPADASSDGAFPASPEEIIPEAKADDSTMLSYAASPRTAIVKRKPGTDPASAVSSGVKTTAKTSRALRKDVKPEAKPKVIAAQPQAARWALDSSYVASKSATAKVPSFANNLVRAVPNEVYTAGFQQGPQVADASRFSGKAVTFMTVAKFSTN
jgi:hypothetical protein